MDLIKRSRREADRMAKEQYAKEAAKQEAECKRIAEMLANMTPEEREAYWKEAEESWQGAEGFWTR